MTVDEKRATYTVRRSTLSLCIGYFLAEVTLFGIAVGMLIIWQEEPAYVDWPIAITSWLVCALFFHFLLFTGTFFRLRIQAGTIEYHAFLRRTKRYHFLDIRNIRYSGGLDIKIVGAGNKKLFYVKRTDKNVDRFMDDISEWRTKPLNVKEDESWDLISTLER